jgi:hypothetical protein
VSYRLRMSAEIGDWLAETCAAEPVAAAELGAALVVLAEATELPGQPLVTDLAAERASAEAGVGDPREAVDVIYQELLEALGPVRRQALIAGGQTATRRIGIRRFDDGRPPEQFSEPLTREQQAAADTRDKELIARWQRLQRKVDAFRTAKETAKAMYTAAEGSLRVHDAIAAAESSGDLAGPDAGPHSAAPDDDDEVAQLNEALSAAEANLRATLTQAKRTLHDIRRASRKSGGQDHQDDPAGDASEHGEDDDDAESPVPGLLELRADPLGTDIRVLFAVEPPGTATLLAVLDGADAISDHRDEAIVLSGQLLTDIRDGSWPPAETEGAAAGEVCFDAAATLLTRLFPDRSAGVRARAAELADLSTLAGLRRNQELTIAEVAASSGLAEHRVWEIEHAGLRSVELSEAAAYVRALGGRLDVAASMADRARILLG